MATSFGAIMASAADQSRLAREKDEANQLSMMQAGFIPKEQPPQAEPSGLQSMLSSVRDQYAYQPQHAPTDYVPGPGHASSMQAAQHEQQLEVLKRQQGFGGRFDELTKADMEAVTQERELSNEWFNRRTAADIANTEANTALNNAQTSSVITDTSGKKLDNSLKRMTQRLRIESITLGNNEIRANLEREKGLNPLRKSLIEHQIDAAELTYFKSQNALVTATNGDQYFMAYDAKNGTVTPRIFSKAGEDMPEQMRMMSLGIQIANTLEGEPKKAMMATLLTQFRIMGLENDMNGGVLEGEDILNPPETVTSPSNSKKGGEIPSTINATPEEMATIGRRAQAKALKKRGLISEADHKFWNGGKRPESSLQPGNPGHVLFGKDQKKWDKIDKDITSYIEAGDQ
tara:strand:+ start:387 stop:1592 length:1206 start_codon:yes stop_codon:yes gene_type:complete